MGEIDASRMKGTLQPHTIFEFSKRVAGRGTCLEVALWSRSCQVHRRKNPRRPRGPGNGVGAGASRRREASRGSGDQRAVTGFNWSQPGAALSYADEVFEGLELNT